MRAEAGAAGSGTAERAVETGLSKESLRESAERSKRPDALSPGHARSVPAKLSLSRRRTAQVGGRYAA